MSNGGFWRRQPRDRKGRWADMPGRGPGSFAARTNYVVGKTGGLYSNRTTAFGKVGGAAAIGLIGTNTLAAGVAFAPVTAGFAAAYGISYSNGKKLKR